MAFAGPCGSLSAQGPAGNRILISSVELPDAPVPAVEVVSTDQTGQTPPTASMQEPSPAAQDAPGQASANSKAPATEAGTEQSKRDKAEQQIKEQEHQRVMGIIPSFNTSYRSDAVSLTAKQKVSLAFRSAVDPYAFAIAFIVAGLGEAKGDSGFGWGPEGYFKRSGAAYLDAFDGTMIGNAFLPVILHQDPRYFRLGHGTFRHRLFYAVATSFVCKHDNTGKWEPNYSNVGGNMIAGAISNLYSPDSKSGAAQTIEAGMTVTLEGTFGGTLQEFWPDIARKVFHKDPTNGLDAQARAADEAKKKTKPQQE
jgi:hypothetical protein